jgi:hypothetical protein
MEADVASYLLGSDCDGNYRRNRPPCRALPLSEHKDCQMGSIGAKCSGNPKFLLKPRDFPGSGRLVDSQSGARCGRCLCLGSVARITVAIVGPIDLGLACL